MFVFSVSLWFPTGATKSQPYLVPSALAFYVKRASFAVMTYFVLRWAKVPPLVISIRFPFASSLCKAENVPLMMTVTDHLEAVDLSALPLND